jgi:hypothetical protein
MDDLRKSREKANSDFINSLNKDAVWLKAKQDLEEERRKVYLDKLSSYANNKK